MDHGGIRLVIAEGVQLGLRDKPFCSEDGAYLSYSVIRNKVKLVALMRKVKPIRVQQGIVFKLPLKFRQGG